MHTITDQDGFTALPVGTRVYSTRRNLFGVIKDSQVHIDRTHGDERPYVWVDFSEHFSRDGHFGGTYLADLRIVAPGE